MLMRSLTATLFVLAGAAPAAAACAAFTGVTEAFNAGDETKARAFAETAGTANCSADERTLEALSRRGYDGARHRARQFSVSSFAENDLVVALDRTHERILRAWARSEDDEGKVSLLRDYDPDAASSDVPDPYYAGPGTFDAVLAMIESATRGLFSQLEPALRANRVPSRVFRGAEQEEYR